MCYRHLWTDFSRLPTLLSPLIYDYVRHEDGVRPFYRAYPNVDAMRAQIALRADFTSGRRALLVDYMTRLHAPLTLSEAQQKNISALHNANTFTITTAHQPNIFAGPLYTLVKIAQTIKASKDLCEALPDYHFVPVFFIGSEDHDTEELNHIYLHNKKMVWQDTQTGAFGKRLTNKAIAKLLDEITQELAAYPHIKKLKSLLAQSYGVANRPIGEALMQLLHALFSHEGLVFITPDDVELKRAFVPYIQADLIEQKTETIIQASGARLQEAGYKMQAQPRAINLFYMQNGVRERIVFEQNKYRAPLSNISYSEQEIITHLHARPEHFSPNVFMRALMQEFILPNLMYIGGAGEIAYWLEMKDFFAHYKIPFPLLKVRNSLSLLDGASAVKLLKKSKLSVEDIFENTRTWTINEYQKEIERDKNIVAEARAQIAQSFGTLAQYFNAQNAPLSTHIRALQTINDHKLEKLQRKIIGYYTRREDDTQARRNRLRAQLLPAGILQERRESFMPYYARYGDDFLRLLTDSARTFEDGLILALLDDNVH